MPLCPVCGNAQETPGACDVCGLPLPGAPAPTPAAGGPTAPATVEGLEPTRFEPLGPSAPDPLPEPLPELEPTGFPPGDPFREVEPAPGEDSSLELDRGRSAPVDVSPELLPDLEPTSAPPVADTAASPASHRVCRYCRSPAAPSEPFCRTCGMRLPALGGGSPSAGASGDDGASSRCGCGAPVAGPRCPVCGARRGAP